MYFSKEGFWSAVGLFTILGIILFLIFALATLGDKLDKNKINNQIKGNKMSESSKWIIWELNCGTAGSGQFVHNGMVSVNKVQSLVQSGTKVYINNANNVNFEFPFVSDEQAFEAYDKLKIALLAAPGTKIEAPGLIKIEVR